VVDYFQREQNASKFIDVVSSECISEAKYQSAGKVPRNWPISCTALPH